MLAKCQHYKAHPTTALHCAAWTARAAHVQPPYSTAFTIDSITFFASPNTIIVFGW